MIFFCLIYLSRADTEFDGNRTNFPFFAQKYQRPSHGAGAQVDPCQLDERVQEVVPHPQSNLPHW